MSPFNKCSMTKCGNRPLKHSAFSCISIPLHCSQLLSISVYEVSEANFFGCSAAFFSQYTTLLFDPPFFFCAAYLVRLSLSQENVIILKPSIRWLSFKTCMRKALQHNRSVGAWPVCLYRRGARGISLECGYCWVSSSIFDINIFEKYKIPTCMRVTLGQRSHGKCLVPCYTVSPGSYLGPDFASSCRVQFSPEVSKK